MYQTFILRQDIPPHEGFKNGENRSICGNCPHAGWNNGSCYIRWFQSPLAVWKCYRRNRYKKFSNDDLKYLEGSALILGSAGDPAMIPISVFKPLLDRCKTHTGYTHQWMHEWAEDYKGICQASCDGLIQYVEASSHGWKCFSVKHQKNRERPLNAVCVHSVMGLPPMYLSMLMETLLNVYLLKLDLQ